MSDPAVGAEGGAAVATGATDTRVAAAAARSDVIVAVATPPGRGGIGIVRLSGPSLATFIDAVVGKPLAPRRATIAAFLDAAGVPIDQGIALHFPAPASYTGEDVLELHAHGGPVVMRMLVRRCVDLGARLALPGEFSLRAFLNDRLDLAQAESVADLIDASTETAARAAMRSLGGEFSGRVQALVAQLVALRAFTEASLDFPEEDIEFVRAADAAGQLGRIRASVDEVLGDAHTGSLLREGIHVVLIGRPNVGKSSLLNRLAGEDVAIVTEVEGTTRDAIRQSIDLEGVPLHVIDTAGLRATEDPIEKIGIERTWAAVARADLALLLVDSRQGPTAEDTDILGRLPATLPRIVVRNKVDLTGEGPGIDPAGRRGEEAPRQVRVSAKTGAGIADLSRAILRQAGYVPREEGAFLARERHLGALREAQAHLAAAADHLAAAAPPLELFAEELRLAQESLGAITGEYTADDMLGEIFARFCIGK